VIALLRKGLGALVVFRLSQYLKVRTAPNFRAFPWLIHITSFASVIVNFLIERSSSLVEKRFDRTFEARAPPIGRSIRQFGYYACPIG
jgi:hypothetical protein